MTIKTNYLTVKEFAIELKVHPTTVIRAIKYGRIHAIRLGTGKKASYRIPESEFMRMLDFDLREVVERIAKDIKEN